MIVVSNRMFGKVSMKDGMLVTSKKHGTHGIGTQNAFAVIKKYHGEYEIQVEDNVFSVQMTFT